MTLTVGSLFAGVGGFDIAAERAGMTVKWMSEVDKAASGVLAHRFPDVPNLGDIHDITIESAGPVDLLVGGFPCQSYSVAGNRGGLAEDRGALWWEFHRLIEEGLPTWVVGENVPGLLSSGGGRDFTTILKSLVQLGYSVAFRILDAQHFGVPQRRRRLILVGHLGDRPRSEVLAIAEGLSGTPDKSFSTRQGFTPGTRGSADSDRVFHIKASTIGRGVAHGGNATGVTDAEEFPSHCLDTVGPPGVAVVPFTQNQRGEVRVIGDGDVVGALPADGGAQQTNYLQTKAFRVLRSDQYTESGVASTIAARDYKSPTDLVTAKAFSVYPEGGQGADLAAVEIDGAVPPITATNPRHTDRGAHIVTKGVDLYNQTLTGDLHVPLRTAGGHGAPAVLEDTVVRRLTELECERLQGFPDQWTDTPGNSMSGRYKQMGNAVAVPVATWVLEQIVEADAADKKEARTREEARVRSRARGLV